MFLKVVLSVRKTVKIMVFSVGYVIAVEREVFNL